MVSRACWGGCIGTEPCSDVSQPVGMDSGKTVSSGVARMRGSTSVESWMLWVTD